MTYCVANDIALYVPMYAPDSVFDVTTRPTGTQVGVFIADVSGIVDTLIAQYNLTVEEDTDLFTAVSAFVKGQVADLVLMVHERGRFGPTGRVTENGSDMRSAYSIITSDAAKFLKAYAEQTGVGPSESVARVIMF